MKRASVFGEHKCQGIVTPHAHVSTLDGELAVQTFLWLHSTPWLPPSCHFKLFNKNQLAFKK